MSILEVILNLKSNQSEFSAAAQTKRLRNNFIKQGFTHYTFIANKGCCNICERLNKRSFLVSELRIGYNAPPMHENCRCSMAAYEDEDEYDAWLDFLANGGTSKEWKKKHKRR